MRVLILDAPNKPHAQAGEIVNLPDGEAMDMIARGAAMMAAPDEPSAASGLDLSEADEPDPLDEQPSPDETPGKVRRRTAKAKQPASRKR